MTTAEVHVIGAGLWGLAVAYELVTQSPGTKVHLWDRNEGPACGISALPASIITSLRSDVDQVDLSLRTLRLIQQFEREDPGCTGWKGAGSVYLCNEEGTEAICKQYAMAKSLGLDVEWLDARAVSVLAPWLDKTSWNQAIWLPREGYVDAYLLAQAFWNRAKAAGVEAHWNISIDRLVVENQQVSGFVTSTQEHMSATCIVVAAGPWSNVLLHQHGCAVPMAPVRSQYWITAKHETEFPSNASMVFYPQHRWYVRPESGALLFGVRETQGIAHDARNLTTDISRYVGNVDDPMGLNDLHESYETLVSCIPALRSKGLAHHVSGPSSYTLDSQPTIGPLTQVQGLWVATGCNGSGVAYCAGVGQRLTRALLADPTGQTKNELPYSWNPSRVTDLDPFDAGFLNACARTRSSKFSG